MGKKKSSPPPKPPGMSDTEKQIQSTQLQLMQQQLAAANQAQGNAQSDRASLQQVLQTMQNGGRQLTSQENDLIDQMTQAYSKVLTDGINNGVVGQQLDRNRSNSIADLVGRGVLNSTTGQQVLGDIEKNRSNLLAQAADQTGQARLDLTNQFRTNAQNMTLNQGNFLQGAQGQLLNYASQANQIGANAGAQANQSAQAYNMLPYQSALQNWQYTQNKPKTNWGGVIGAAAGGALGAFGGPMGMMAGASLGSTLGSAF